MIEKESWMQNIVAKLKKQFGNRLLFVGLQGSYQRNESTETSDFDVMVVLDELSISDLDNWQGDIALLPAVYYEKLLEWCKAVLYDRQ